MPHPEPTQALADELNEQAIEIKIWKGQAGQAVAAVRRLLGVLRILEQSDNIPDALKPQVDLIRKHARSLCVDPGRREA